MSRYRILEELGRADAGTLYRAVDTTTDREVVLKELNAAVDDVEREDWQRRFLRGLGDARRIDHPNVVRVLDGGVEDDRAWVVTEAADGVTLATHMETSPAVSRRLDLAIAVADALAAAHAHGVLHEALRPENIMVADDGTPRLTDFGVARGAASDSSPIAGSVSAHYRAPEQVYGLKSDERTDVFSLGVVLYEMFYGRRPFEGASWIQITRKILNVDPPHLEDASEVPAPVRRVIGRALAKSPRDRYQSMVELRQDLVACRRRLDAPDEEATLDQEVITAESPTEPGLRVAEAYLVVHEGDEQRLVHIRKGEFTLGRRGENDLSLIEEHISRVHARIVRRGNQFDVVDRNSRHGTYINGERIADSAQLRDGDRIELGRGSRFQLTFHEGKRPTTSSLIPSATLARRELEMLLDVTAALNSSLSVDGLLHIIIDSALTITGAERGFIMLQDTDGRFTTRIRRHVDSAQPMPPEDGFSTGAVQRCITSQQPFFAHNVDELDEFSERDSVVDLNLKSILCVPLLYRTQVLGVLYLDSQELKSPFRESQLDLLLAFASQAAVSLENARLYEMAIIDPLTAVYRRHHFESRLHEEFQRSERYHSPLSLVFVDVDHFKTVNDTLGHPRGDSILKSVASLIRSASRNTDLAARYGGDEFVLLAPETDLTMAEVLAQRLSSGLAAECRSLVGDAVPLSLSIGIASYPSPGIASPDELLAAADAALLDAKKQGRNRIVCRTAAASDEAPPAA